MAKYETKDMSKDIGIKSGVGIAKFCSSSEIKNKLKNEYSYYSFFIYGGNASSLKSLISSTIEKVKEILSKDANFDGTQEALPINYKDNFIDDASPAIINFCTVYYKILIEER